MFAALDMPRTLRLLNAAHASARKTNEQLAVVVAANDLAKTIESWDDGEGGERRGEGSSWQVRLCMVACCDTNEKLSPVIDC